MVFHRELSADVDCDSPREDTIESISQLPMTSLLHLWCSPSSSVKSWYKYPSGCRWCTEIMDTGIEKIFGRKKGFTNTRWQGGYFCHLSRRDFYHIYWTGSWHFSPLKNHITCLETEIHLLLRTNGRAYLSFSLLLKKSSSGPPLRLASWCQIGHWSDHGAGPQSRPTRRNHH